MGRLSPRKTQSVMEMEQAVPALPAVEILRRNLLYTMLDTIRNDDMAAIVAQQVNKAKDGDTRSARLIIEMVQANAAAAAPTHMQQAIVVTGQESAVRFLSDSRRNIVQLLVATGPLTTLEVAKTMHMLLNDAAGALDHDWFVKIKDRWTISAKGREEVLFE